MKDFSSDQYPKDVRAVMLAAGEGRRFGGNKQLAQLGDCRLIERCLRAFGASHIAATTIVLGARAEEIYPFVQFPKCSAVVHADWNLGIGSSIKCGFRASAAFEDEDCTGVVIAVADQPHISRDHLDSLLREHVSNPHKIIASGYAGNIGTPVLFPRRCFLELANLPDGVGAKSLVFANQDQTIVIGDELLALDIDTKQDLENWVEADSIRKPGLCRTDYAYKCR